MPDSLEILKAGVIYASEFIVFPSKLRILEINYINGSYLIYKNLLFLKNLEFANVPWKCIQYLPKNIKKLCISYPSNIDDYLLDFSVFENLEELIVRNPYLKLINVLFPNTLKSLTIPSCSKFQELNETNLVYLNLNDNSEKISFLSTLKHLRCRTKNLDFYKNIVKTLETCSVDYDDSSLLKDLMIYSHKLKNFGNYFAKTAIFYPQTLLDSDYVYEITLQNYKYEFRSKPLKDYIELKKVDYVIEKVEQYGCGILSKILKKFKNCSCLSGEFLLELFGDIDTYDIDIFISWTKYSDLVKFIKKELNNSVLKIDYNILEVYSPKLRHILQFIFVDCKKNPMYDIVQNFDFDITKCCIYIEDNKFKFKEFYNALDCIKKRTTTFHTLKIETMSKQRTFKMLKKFIKKRILMKIDLQLLDNLMHRNLIEERNDIFNILNDRTIYFFSKYNKFPEILLDKLEKFCSCRSIYLSTKNSSCDKINRTIVEKNKKLNYTSVYHFNNIQ